MNAGASFFGGDTEATPFLQLTTCSI